MHIRHPSLIGVWLASTISSVTARVRFHAQWFPACQIDPSSTSECTNPLYTFCSRTLCCGPDHFCCNGGTACCYEDGDWNRYEIVGVVTGAIAWVCIAAVIVILILPRLLRRFRSGDKKSKRKHVEVVTRDRQTERTKKGRDIDGSAKKDSAKKEKDKDGSTFLMTPIH